MAKRFYKEVDVAPRDGGYVILLDGRILKTPGKQALVLDCQSRAELVAGEWRSQRDEIKPETMPCTRLMNVACELTPPRRPELVKEFSSYCKTDLLCFRSEHPRDLAKRQEEVWQPVLDWAAKQHGLALLVTTSIKAPQHTESSVSAATVYANGLGNVELTLLLHFTASFGSGVLALALMEGYLDVATVYAASRLDEVFQNELWGEDEEAALRAQNIGEELAALAALIQE